MMSEIGWSIQQGMCCEKYECDSKIFWWEFFGCHNCKHYAGVENLSNNVEIQQGIDFLRSRGKWLGECKGL